MRPVRRSPPVAFVTAAASDPSESITVPSRWDSVAFSATEKFSAAAGQRGVGSSPATCTLTLPTKDRPPPSVTFMASVMLEPTVMPLGSACTVTEKSCGAASLATAKASVDRLRNVPFAKVTAGGAACDAVSWPKGPDGKSGSSARKRHAVSPAATATSMTQVTLAKYGASFRSTTWIVSGSGVVKVPSVALTLSE